MSISIGSDYINSVCVWGGGGGIGKKNQSSQTIDRCTLIIHFNNKKGAKIGLDEDKID